MNTKGNKQKRRRGFTLLELLAVMSIMGMLTTLAVTSYFSAIRGMARRSAVKHFVDSLYLARQRACIEGVRVSVIAFNEPAGENKSEPVPSYVVCKEIGRITRISTSDSVKLWVDEFTQLDKMFGTEDEMFNQGGNASGYRGSMRIYNLKTGKWLPVNPWVTLHNPTRRSPYQSMNVSIPAYGFTRNKNADGASDENIFTIGDTYGVEVAPPGSLPKGFTFKELNNDEEGINVVCFTFRPDGTMEQNNNVKNTVTITELNSSNKSRKVSVSSKGEISWDS